MRLNFSCFANVKLMAATAFIHVQPFAKPLYELRNSNHEQFGRDSPRGSLGVHEAQLRRYRGVNVYAAAHVGNCTNCGADGNALRLEH